MTTPSSARRVVAAVAAAGLTLVGLSVGASAASAAPGAPGALSPAFPDGTAAPSMVTYGAVGYELTSMNGTNIPHRTERGLSNLPDHATSSGSARFMAPPAESGQRVNRGFAGTFSYTIANSTGGKSQFVWTPNGKLHDLIRPDQTPSVTSQFSDSWMWAGTTGTWTYTYDFSGLAGGVLPAGAVLSTTDVDVCEEEFTTPEGVTMSSDASGEWLQYWNNQGGGEASDVTRDGSTYTVAPHPPCVSGANAMAETFKTTRDIKKLTVTVQSVTPPREGTGLWWELLAPTEPQATMSTKATNKADGSKHLSANGTISDEITYAGLQPGRQYTIRGILMNKATGQATSVTASKSFTPTASDGSVEVDYRPGAAHAGQSVVVFETISDSAGEVVSHRDLASAAQTVTIDADKPANVTPATDTDSDTDSGTTAGTTVPASAPRSGPTAVGPSVNTGGTVLADGVARADAANTVWASGSAAAGAILLLGVAAMWMRQRKTARRQSAR